MEQFPHGDNNLAMCYQAAGKRARAQPLFKRALRIFEKRLGAKHPHTVACRENSARSAEMTFRRLATLLLIRKAPYGKRLLPLSNQSYVRVLEVALRWKRVTCSRPKPVSELS